MSAGFSAFISKAICQLGRENILCPFKSKTCHLHNIGSASTTIENFDFCHQNNRVNSRCFFFQIETQQWTYILSLHVVKVKLKKHAICKAQVLNYWEISENVLSGMIKHDKECPLFLWCLLMLIVFVAVLLLLIEICLLITLACKKSHNFFFQYPVSFFPA